jgi:hypothetical protein
LIPTLTRTSPKPLFARPISVRSVVATNNIVNILLFIKRPPFAVAPASFLIVHFLKAPDRLTGFFHMTGHAYEFYYSNGFILQITFTPEKNLKKF